MVHYSVSFSNSTFCSPAPIKQSEVYNCEVCLLCNFVFYFIYVTTGIRTLDSGIQAAESLVPASNLIVIIKLRKLDLSFVGLNLFTRCYKDYFFRSLSHDHWWSHYSRFSIESSLPLIFKTPCNCLGIKLFICKAPDFTDPSKAVFFVTRCFMSPSAHQW